MVVDTVTYYFLVFVEKPKEVTTSGFKSAFLSFKYLWIVLINTNYIKILDNDCIAINRENPLFINFKIRLKENV